MLLPRGKSKGEAKVFVLFWRLLSRLWSLFRRQQNIKKHKIKHRRRDDLNFPTPYIVQESDGALSITASDQA
jgi:hypothetical protein